MLRLVGKDKKFFYADEDAFEISFILNYKHSVMDYIFLIITILSETAAVIFMKLSNGFQQKYYAMAAVITYAASFIFLTLSLKQLPASIANAIWAGASTLLVAGASVYFLHEKLSWIQITSMILIAIGLIGLNIKEA